MPGIFGAIANMAGVKRDPRDYSGIPAPNVDLPGAEKRATKGNIAALPDLEELAGKVDSFSTDELLKRLEQFSPGIGKVIGKIPDILDKQVSGEVPDDVLRAIKRGVGSHAFASGLSPGQRTSLTAEDIGKTSYAIQQEGITAASRWMAQVESGAPRFDFTRMFITPAQEAAQEWQNQQATASRAIAMENIRASNSIDQELYSITDWADSTGKAAASFYAGGGFSSLGSLGGMMGGGGGESAPSAGYQINTMRPMSEWG